MSTAKPLRELLRRIRKLITPNGQPQTAPAWMAFWVAVGLMLSGCASAPAGNPERIFCVVYHPVCFGAADTVSEDAERTTIKNNERWFADCNKGISACQPGL